MSDDGRSVPRDLRHNPFYCWMWNKVYKEKEGCIVAISGKVGKGKTTLACRLSELFDRDYNNRTRFPIKETNVTTNKSGLEVTQELLAPRLCYSIEDFRRFRTKVFPMGTAFIIDEGQATVNSRDWNTKKNRFFNILMSTGRVFNSFIFVIMPSFGTIDSQARGYVDALINVVAKDTKNKKTYFRAGLLIPNFDLPVLFRRRDVFGRAHKADLYYESLPSHELDMAQKVKSVKWKRLVAKGLIAPDGSFIGEDVHPLIATVEKKVKLNRDVVYENNKRLAEDWVLKLKDRRNDFGYNGKYVITKIRAITNESRMVAELIAFGFKELDKRIGLA